MSLSRAALFIASIFLGLSPALGQQSQTSADPPLFEGIMVDAKGKTVGRLVIVINDLLTNFVVRQMSGVWVALPVGDLTTGFQISSNNNQIHYFYKSADCTEEAQFLVSPNNTNTGPVFGVAAVVPPATQPSIYFAGMPASVVIIHSFRVPGGGCQPMDPSGGSRLIVGPVQSAPVSSLGLTLPFSIK